MLRMPLLAVLTLVGIGATAEHHAADAGTGGSTWPARSCWAARVGNLGDRLLDGGVTDFIFVHFFPYIFNVADIAITIGGVLLVLRMLLDRPRRRARAHSRLTFRTAPDMPQLARRFTSLPPYPLTDVPGIKRDLKARGVDVIDLGTGDADLAAAPRRGGGAARGGAGPRQLALRLSAGPGGVPRGDRPVDGDALWRRRSIPCKRRRAADRQQGRDLSPAVRLPGAGGRHHHPRPGLPGVPGRHGAGRRRAVHRAPAAGERLPGPAGLHPGGRGAARQDPVPELSQQPHGRHRPARVPGGVRGVVPPATT